MMPYCLASWIGRALGWIWFYLIPVRKKVALANLELAFPQLDKRARKRIAAAAFKNMALGAVEILRAPSMDKQGAEKLFEMVGLEHLDKALERGKGVIIASAHFGNFDLAACAGAMHGFDLYAVTRQQSQRGVNRFWMEVRKGCGVKLISAKSSVWKINRALKSGGMLVLVIDQHMPVGRGIPIPFFGKLASTIDAPAVLSLATGAPIVPALVSRLPNGKHSLVFEPALNVQQGQDRRQDIEGISMCLNQWLEDRIRQKPDQWIWVHRRWKLADRAP